MSTLFNDPSGGAVEPVVVTRGEVYDAEEKGISGPDAGSRGASPAFDSCARTHLGCHLNRFEQVLAGSLGIYYGRVGCLAKAAGWAMTVLRSGIGIRGHVSRSLGTGVGGTNQLGQAVLDSVDFSKLAVEYNLVIGIGEVNPCTGRRFVGLDSKECVQGVGDSLNLLDLEVFNGAEVKDRSICGADLEESRRHDVSQPSKGRMIEGVRGRGKSHGRGGGGS